MEFEYFEGVIEFVGRARMELTHADAQTFVKKYTEDCCALCFQATGVRGVCDDCLETELEKRRDA